MPATVMQARGEQKIVPLPDTIGGMIRTNRTDDAMLVTIFRSSGIELPDEAAGLASLICF